MSQIIFFQILRAGFKEITGPKFRPAAITKGQKLFGHVFDVEETKICTFCRLSWWPGISCFDRWIHLPLRSLRLGSLKLLIKPYFIDISGAFNGPM